MVNKEYYIGMDVHKDFVQMAVFEEKGENPIYERKLNNDNGLLVKEAISFARRGKTIAAYEAGCLGYVIQLRHGHTFTEGKTNWTHLHWRWMDKIKFANEHEKMVYEEYRSQIKSLEERLTRLEIQITKTAESQRYKAAVSKLRAFKGIYYIIALSALCEIGDFRRFADAKSFMSYREPLVRGFVPSENSREICQIAVQRQK